LKYSTVLNQLERCIHPVTRSDLKLQVLGKSLNGRPILKIQMGIQGRRRILLSAGIHGDEPAGIFAILQLLEQSLLAPYLNHWEIIILPCLNPDGFEQGTRNNAEDIDLNRQFKLLNPPLEVKLAQSVFDIPFDLTLELHEDIDSPGYYLYQKSITGSINHQLGKKILQKITAIMPVNQQAEIDGMPATNGVIDRLKDPVEMDFWPMALFSFHKGTSCCFTLETASKFPMTDRVAGHSRAVLTALNHFQS